MLNKFGGRGPKGLKIIIGWTFGIYIWNILYINGLIQWYFALSNKLKPLLVIVTISKSVILLPSNFNILPLIWRKLFENESNFQSFWFQFHILSSLKQFYSFLYVQNTHILLLIHQLMEDQIYDKTWDLFVLSFN